MTTGNPERDAFIVRAIKQCSTFHEQPTLVNVADKLRRDFDLLESELADALAELAEPTEAKPFILNDGTPARLPPTNEPAEPETAASEADEVPEAELTHRQAQAAVEAAHTQLGNARVAVKIAQQKHADAKGALAAAILAWQTGGDFGTPEERRMRMVRDHLASEQAKRATKVAAQGQRVGNSVVDVSAKYSRDPTANGFARAQMRNGGSHRGAYPKSMRGQTVPVKA